MDVPLPRSVTGRRQEKRDKGDAMTDEHEADKADSAARLAQEVAVADAVTHYKARVGRLKTTVTVLTVALLLATAAAAYFFVQAQLARTQAEDEWRQAYEERQQADRDWFNDELAKQRQVWIKEINASKGEADNLRKDVNRKTSDHQAHKKKLEQNLKAALAEIDKLKDD